MPETYYFAVQDLKDFVTRYLTRWDISIEDAVLAAEVLVSADMRGVDSHGVIRLKSYYGSRLAKNQIDAHAPFSILKETASSLVVDACNGLGHPAGVKTMKLCIEKASQNGICMATVRNSNHYGIAGYYAMMALEKDMIGISFTNSGPSGGAHSRQESHAGDQSHRGGCSCRFKPTVRAGYGHQHCAHRSGCRLPKKRKTNPSRLGHR